MSVELLLGIIGAFSGILALFISFKGNKISHNANELSENSLRLAKEANEMTKEQLNLKVATYCTYDPEKISIGLSQPNIKNKDATIKATSYQILLSINPKIFSGCIQSIFLVGKSTDGEIALTANRYNDNSIFIDNKKLLDWFFVLYFQDNTVKYFDLFFIQIELGQQNLSFDKTEIFDKGEKIDYKVRCKAPKLVKFLKIPDSELFASRTYMKKTGEIKNIPTSDELIEEYQNYVKKIKKKYNF